MDPALEKSQVFYFLFALKIGRKVIHMQRHDIETVCALFNLLNLSWLVLVSTYFFAGVFELLIFEWKHDYSFRTCSTRNDLWALGCTLYQMLSGTSPFKDASEWLIFQRIIARDIRFPNYFSNEARDLIDQLLVSYNYSLIFTYILLWFLFFFYFSPFFILSFFSDMHSSFFY